MNQQHRKISIGVATSLTGIAMAIALAGCGGGSGGSVAASDSQQAPLLTVTGTATTGTAVAAAPVSVKCQAGTAVATTKTDGTYTVTVSGASLPCALELTNPADSTKLHSIATGSGTAATSNITPLTELTVANLTKQSPSTVFAGFDAATAAKTITSDTVKAAQTAVVSFLSTNHVDVSKLANTDLISTPLVAATAANPASGDAQNNVLAAMQKTITAPLTDLTAILASAPTGCVVAKSGKYTAISYTGTVASYDVDFAARTILFPGNTKPTTFSASVTQPCEFTTGDLTVNFASSGMAIYKVASAAEIGIAFPTQSFDKGVFGDTYNVSGYFANGNGFAAPGNAAPNAQFGTIKIGADGSFRLCGESDYSDQCTLNGDAITGKFSSTPNADGSGNMVFADGSTSKLYSYTAPNGDKLLAMGDTQSFLVAAKQVTIASSDIEIGSSSVFYSVRGYAGIGTGATLTSGTNKVTGVTATQTTSLQHVDDGVTPDETLVTLINNPWRGMRHRDADTVTNKAARTGMATRLGFSTTGSVNKLSSTGITAPNTAVFSLSIAR